MHCRAIVPEKDGAGADRWVVFVEEVVLGGLWVEAGMSDQAQRAKSLAVESTESQRGLKTVQVG